jgi:hypothetical protein
MNVALISFQGPWLDHHPVQRYAWRCVRCAGASIGGVKLSGPVSACSAFKGLLDMRRLAVMGHSCGGATAAAVVAAHAEFKCGVSESSLCHCMPDV